MANQVKQFDMSTTPTTSKAESLQIKKKQSAMESITKAQTAFLQMYDGKEAEKKFAQEQQFCILAIQKNPTILNCSPNSIFSAVASVAMTGLTLNPVLGLCHLVPRGEQCSLVIDYKGLLELLGRTGKIKSMSAGVVYEGDEFDFAEGSNGFVKHKKVLNRAGISKFIAGYSVAAFADGTNHVHILDANAIDKRRKVAQTDKIWSAWFDEMAIKTAIRSHYKYLPKLPQIDEAMRLLDEEQGVVHGQQVKNDLLPDGILDDIQEAEVLSSTTNSHQELPKQM